MYKEFDLTEFEEVFSDLEMVYILFHIMTEKLFMRRGGKTPHGYADIFFLLDREFKTHIKRMRSVIYQ